MKFGRTTLRLFVLSAALVALVDAQAVLIRYGQVGAVDAGQIARDTGVGGPDSDVSFTGYALNKGATTAVAGTAGNFKGETVGALLTDPVTGVRFEVDAVSGGSALNATAVGSTLSILGGHNDRIETNESVTCSFSSDVQCRYIKVFQAGSRGVLGSVGKISMGTNEVTFTVQAAAQFVDLGNTVLTPSDSLTLSTVSGGGWALNVLLVEGDPVVSSLNASVTNRAGADVTSQLLIDSDHMHVTVESDQPVVDFTYKFIVQSSEPTGGEWTNATELDFYKDLFFYMKPTNQWVQILADDGVNPPLQKVWGLQGGVLTAPPDDPILPADFTAGMGRGLIVECQPHQTVFPEIDTVEMKKAGFNHIRMHLGQDANYNLNNQTPEVMFQTLDRWVDQIARHGMYCHIGNRPESYPTTNDTDDGSAVWAASYQAEQVAWFAGIADYCKTRSHRLAYHMILETLGNSVMLDSAKLNPMYAAITEAVRLVEPARLLIYTPRKANDIGAIDELTFPYTDQNPGDGITTGSGDYWLSDWHGGFQVGWAGGAFLETVAQRDQALAQLQVALDWISSNNVPLILSAVRPTSSLGTHHDYIPNRINGMEMMLEKVAEASIPVGITWLTHDNFNIEGDPSFGFRGWIPEKLVMLEVMNGEVSLNPDDPDGDLISTDDEVNIYGTDPNSADTDGDNILDTYECQYASLDPNDPSDGHPSFPEANLSINADYDGDGMGNAWELLHAWDWHNNGIRTPLDFEDPADAYTDLEKVPDGLVNLWDDLLQTTPHGDEKAANTQFSDLDKDGVSTLDEIHAGTWPDRYTDSDFDGLKRGADPVPYINDTSHIVRYVFDSIVSTSVPDSSSQGGNNEGTLIGDAQGTDAGIVYFAGQNGFLDIPTTDFGPTAERSVTLHFYPKTVSNIQLLYKDGTGSSGMSVYLHDATLWMGVWNLTEETFVELGPVSADTWQSVSVKFNGARGLLSGHLMSNNVFLSRTNVSTLVTTLGDASGKTTLGGSDEATRFCNVAGAASETLSNQYFNGALDDVLIYNRQLSDVETARLCRNDLAPLKAQPIDSADQDQDGLENVFDNDDDNDGILDLFDAFPLDASESKDTDRDGVGDTMDPDDDNDGMLDESDPYPLDFADIEDTALLLAYSFDEGSGNMIMDGSGNNGHASPLTVAAEWTSGTHNGALDFNTGGGIPFDSAALASLDTEVTMTFWSKGNEIAAMVPFQAVDAAGVRVLSMTLPWIDTVHWDAGNTGTTVDRISYDFNAANTNTFVDVWRHWAFTKNTAKGKMIVYMDGAELMSGTGKTRSMSGITSAVIGGTLDGSTPYRGSLDDFRIYGRALSPTEIASLSTSAPLSDGDVDGDGVPDVADDFPSDPTEWVDTDVDGIGNNTDPDDDNDGILDVDDPEPLVPLDTDGDGLADTVDPDDDNDGLSDIDEASAGTNPLNPDTDGGGEQDGSEVDAGRNPLFPLDDEFWIPGDVIQFIDDIGYLNLNLYDSEVVGSISWGAQWTNSITQTSGDSGGGIRNNSSMSFDPSGVNLVMFGSAYTNLTELSTFSGYNSILGVVGGTGGGANQRISTDERAVFSFNEDVVLRRLVLENTMDCTLSWGSGSTTSLVSSSSYDFEPGQRLAQGETLSITGDSGSRGIKAIIVELKGARPDSDSDGMSDIVEDYYGFDKQDPSDAALDKDEDGMSNGDEIFAGTVPTDSESVFKFIEMGRDTAKWSSVPGRAYSVHYSDDLITWLPLSGYTNVVASGLEMTLVDPDNTAQSRFYRVKVFVD